MYGHETASEEKAVPKMDHVQSPFGFKKEDFAPFSFPQFPDGFCTLGNENHFPLSRFPSLRNHAEGGERVYSLIKPALLLASRMILQECGLYSIFIKRSTVGSPTIYVPSESELELSEAEVIGCIRSYLPEFEFDPNMDAKSASFEETVLAPDDPHDIVTLDYNLVRFLRSDTSDNYKVAGLFFVAISICDEIAHVLEFRSVRRGCLKRDGKPHATPPGR